MLLYSCFHFSIGLPKESFRALARDLVYCVLLVEFVCQGSARVFQHITQSLSFPEHCVYVAFFFHHLEHTVGFGVVRRKCKFYWSLLILLYFIITRFIIQHFYFMQLRIWNCFLHKFFGWCCLGNPFSMNTFCRWLRSFYNKVGLPQNVRALCF